MSDDLTTAYLLGAEQMRDKLHKQADEIERLRAENEKMREAFAPLLKACEETVENICVDYDTLPKLVRAAAAALRDTDAH